MGVALTFLVLAGCAVSVAFSRRASRAWRWQRSGATYEAPTDYRTALLWSATAVLILLFVLAALLQPGAPRPGSGSAGLVAQATGRPSGGPAGGARTALAAPAGQPQAGVRPAGRGAVPFRLVSAAAGGFWWQGSVAGKPTRVWVPRGYSTAGAPYPVVVAPGADVAGLAAALAAGRGRPFVIVDPGRGPDSDALRRAVTAGFHVARDPHGWGVLGAGSAAASAVQAALAAPDRYGAGVGLNGDYADVVPAARAGARVLLVVGAQDPAQLASAQRLRTALGTRARVRLVGPIQDPADEFGQAAAYLETALRPQRHGRGPSPSRAPQSEASQPTSEPPQSQSQSAPSQSPLSPSPQSQGAQPQPSQGRGTQAPVEPPSPQSPGARTEVSQPRHPGTPGAGSPPPSGPGGAASGTAGHRPAGPADGARPAPPAQAAGGLPPGTVVGRAPGARPAPAAHRATPPPQYPMR